LPFDFVSQALDVGLLPYLLKLLEGELECVENGAATKAQIVKALKAMGRSASYGEKVNSILGKSSIWSDYRDQRHDLFINNTSTAGYLTGEYLSLHSSRSLNNLRNTWLRLVM